MEKEKLKACPFCWCAAKETQFDDNGDIVYGVKCTNTMCIGFDIKPQFFSAAKARKAWNRRAEDGK